jgi:DNA-binding transcriptional regulator GbsR (MarR family)
VIFGNKDKKSVIMTLYNEDKNNQQVEIDKEIEELIQECIHYFINSRLCSGRKTIMLTVLSHLYIQRNLTQEDQQKLTGFSLGTISNTLNEILEMGILEKEFIPNTHKILYKIPFLSKALTTMILYPYKMLIKQEPLLQNIKRELETSELSEEKGYEETCNIINNLLKIMPTYKEFVKRIEEVSVKLEKTDTHNRRENL